MKKHLVKILLAACLLPAAATAAGAQLSIQQVELARDRWPRARAWVSVVGASGAPIPGLAQDLFKVYESGRGDSSKVVRVDSFEAAQTGISLVIVVQASGAMAPIQEGVQKALAAFVNGLGEKDQVSVVAYGDTAEMIAPFSADKGEVAGRIGKVEFKGSSFLLYDGLNHAIPLFAQIGRGAQSAKLPTARAVVLISDGRDNNSTTDVEKVVSEAVRRRIPIYAVGHSELEQESLANLETLSRRTGGIYRAAQAGDDIAKALTAIRDHLNGMYVVEWKTRLDHDGKDHRIEIAMESDGVGLKSALTVRTPDFIDWLKIGIIAAVVVLLAIGGLVVYAVTRPKPPPTRFCPVCKRAQMPEWDVCLFCLKAAKGRLFIQKGNNKGKTYPLVGKIVSLGSGPENSIRLLDGAVSAKHAGVSIDGNKFEIVDLGSKNGVLVNGKKAPRRFLRNGDVITLGMTELKFESAVAAADEETGSD